MHGTVTLLLLLCSVASASPHTRTTASGSISGRVTLGGRPVPRVPVTLLPERLGGKPPGLGTTSTTNEDGRFRFDEVSAGSYVVNAFAPGFVGPSDGFSPFEPGKIVTVTEGESVEGIEIALKPGAVITGRVVDANRQPIIGMNVRLIQLDDTGQTRPSYITNPGMYVTDDRGMYRLYGLPSGKYKVSVGEAGKAGVFTFPVGAFLRTYYPEATEESKAAVIELEEGGEVATIDIRVSSFVKPYAISGRIIDARTGSPLAGARYGYGAIGDDGRYSGSVSVKSTPATGAGEFSIEGLLPGRYAVFIVNEGKADLYSEPTVVDLKDADIRGIEIKAQRGTSISGLVVFEDNSVSDIPGRLADLVISVSVQSQTLQSVRTDSPPVKPDGAFYVEGLPVGAARLSVNSVRGDKNISLVRMEHNGVEQSDIGLKDGDHLTDVRLILSYGTGVVRGEVKTPSGTLPEGLVVVAQKEGVSKAWTAQVDVRGRFVLEGMPTGEYELTLSGTSGIKPAKRRVSVTTGVESEVTFMLDPAGTLQ